MCEKVDNYFLGIPEKEKFECPRADECRYVEICCGDTRDCVYAEWDKELEDDIKREENLPF